MDDLISRQAAIDAIGEKPLAWTEGEYELGLQNQWERDADAIKILPSVDAVLIKRGKWIKSETGVFICSACLSGYRNQPTLMGDQMFKYCPCCGARMEEAENG